MTGSERSLCIIGVAQETVRPPGPAPEPLKSWERVARAAAEDAGTPDLLRDLGSVQVVYCQSWPYDDPVGRLCQGLGAAPKHRFYSGIGGTTPQVLLVDTAAAMRRGELDTALVVGAEALATKRAANRSGERLAWSHREQERSPFPWSPPHPSETAHEVFQAWETFPLWDTARRAARGDALGSYARANAEVMARLSRVAADNPHAWRPAALDPVAIATAGDGNRYVGWPYTKAEVAVMDVDMAAAVLVVTRERADRLGVPDDRRVYLQGFEYAEDPAAIAARPDMSRSVGMAAAGPGALARAGISIDELTTIDLYSCFPSALNLACDALGLAPDDPRGLTVTGGLPFAGGPASAYLLHSLATTVERLRLVPGRGLVTGIGMHMAKHSAAVYGNEPPLTTPVSSSSLPAPEELHVHTAFAGDGTVSAYTVAHGRDGAPAVGLAVLDVAGGRALARFSRPELLADAEETELIGRRVTASTDGRRNEITW